MNTRRAFLAGAAVTMASASVSRHALAGLPEPVIQALQKRVTLLLVAK